MGLNSVFLSACHTVELVYIAVCSDESSFNYDFLWAPIVLRFTFITVLVDWLGEKDTINCERSQAIIKLMKSNQLIKLRQ